MNPERGAANHAVTMIVAAFCRRDGALLLCRRSSGGSLGLWELPGGKVEPGEDARQALARELLEELGLDADIGETLYDGELPVAGRSCRFVVMDTLLAGDPVSSTAHDALLWVRPPELPAFSLAPLDQPVMPALLRLLE